MSNPARTAFDDARLSHHSAFVIETPSMKRIHNALRLQVDANKHHPPGARPGSVIDGEASLGKTTILRQFGRSHEHRVRRGCRSDLTDTGDELIPVVYNTLPAGTTVKGLNESIIDFYGLPLSRRTTKVELTMQIQKLAYRCATSVFLIDDVHYLQLSNQSDREVNDHLKHLASTIPVTFVYAGIDCEQSGLPTWMRPAASEVTWVRWLRS